MVDVIAECEATGTEAEKALIKACRVGRQCKLNDGKLPEVGAKDAPTVRAALIRALALEETSLHDQGVTLVGAVITGQLDLSFANCQGGLVLAFCRFAEKPTMMQTELAQLSLKNSHIPGLKAQGARVKGSMFLTAVTATGEVDVNSAQIGGQLDLVGAELKNDTGKALHGQSLRAEGGLYFREVAGITGQVDLSSAQVGDLADDVASWQKCANLVLDGFTYDRIGGSTSPKSFAARKSWLVKGSRFNEEFRPQPYTQFAKVMRAAGHLGEARRALAERDTILFQEAEKADHKALHAALHGGAINRSDSGWIWLRLHGRRVWAGLSRRVIGHGHHPQFALFWSLAFWGLGALLYGLAYSAGLMVPNSDVIMTSSEWLAAVEMRPTAPTDLWADSALAAQHYETFYSWIYALDVFLPLVDFGQESTWAATTITNLGKALRALTFLYQIAGWVVTSLGLAAITGFVQRNSPD